jgi:hypothetical protein
MIYGGITQKHWNGGKNHQNLSFCLLNEEEEGKLPLLFVIPTLTSGFHRKIRNTLAPILY